MSISRVLLLTWTVWGCSNGTSRGKSNDHDSPTLPQVALAPTSAKEKAQDTELKSLLYGDQFGGSCSAVLVSPRVALTAAHCLVEEQEVPDPDGKPITIRSYVYETLGGEAVPTLSIQEHPDFEFESLLNDIGLLTLKAPRQPVMQIETSCKPRELVKGTEVIISGYGFEKEAHAHGSKDPHPMVENRFRMIIERTTRTQLAAKPGDGSTCSGFSGAPVFVRDGPDCPPRLVGLVSAGSKNCQGASVFTRIEPYLESFIEPAIAAAP